MLLEVEAKKSGLMVMELASTLVARDSVAEFVLAIDVEVVLVVNKEFCSDDPGAFEVVEPA